MQRTDSFEKTLMLGKIEGRRRRGWLRMRRLAVITESTDVNLSKLQEMVQDREAWSTSVQGGAKSRTWLSNWTKATNAIYQYVLANDGLVTKSGPTLWDPMNCSTPGFSVLTLSFWVCSSSCPLSQWCHPTTSSSVIPFSSFLQSFPASGSFPLNQFFTSGG